MKKMQQGKEKILLFRLLEDAHEEDAVKLVFQTEHTFEFERDNDRIVTKDGVVIKQEELESSVDINAIQAVNDPTGKMLQDSVINAKKLELWEVNLDEDAKNDEDKYEAVYCQGYLNSWSTPSGAEGEVEITTTFDIELIPQFGYTALSEEQEQAVQYAFREIYKLDEKNGDPDNNEGEEED